MIAGDPRQMTYEGDLRDQLDAWAGDGRQAVVIDVDGWATPYLEVRDTAAELRAVVLDAADYWVRYTDRMRVLLFGYDPRVLDHYDEDRADVLAMWDGYPDAVAMIDLDDETLTWEDC